MIMSIIKIKDIMEQNESIPIRLSKVASLDPAECLSETLYEGDLNEIPKQYHELEVLRTGRLLGAGIHNIQVYLGDF